ncbi:MAG: hypothetical protein ACLQNE_37225 [Thermoguttaceae bacterium]
MARLRAKWHFQPVLRTNGKWRLEAFISIFQSAHEFARAVDPSVDPCLPPQCFDPRFITRFFRLPSNAFDHQARGPSGEPGRKETTADIAEFALGGKQQEMTWKEILLAWRRQFPDDHRVKNWESIREAYRRRFGDKAKYRRRGRVEVVDGLPKTHS